ncbi:type-2 protein geranylgeranyltransferase subunit beta [Diplocarpon rosae]|nr:type-2 protein geranylgeranyltransferase subunit beta [Diplocarpon rosae]
MPRTKVESDADLRCSLCPKQPTFSDVSHLLTHVASKSHLAHRFNVELRARDDLAFRHKIEEFDMWYHLNNLDVLLSDRLAAKDQKKARKSRVSNVSTASSASTRKEKRTTKRRRQEKEETPEPANGVLAQTPVYRAPVPRMHHWDGQTDFMAPAAGGDFQDSVYATPTARRHVPGFTRHAATARKEANSEKYVQVNTLHFSPDISASLSTPNKLYADEDEYTERRKPGEKLTDSAKLKGIVWPGMDLFDSATPEMKRMRNQRKDHSVLDEMKATSLLIEADEVSYHPNGDFRGSRDIFGPLSTESSPVAPSIPSAKKRKPRKPTFADVSVNAPRMRAPRGKRPTAANRSPQKRSMPSMATRPNVYLHPAPVLNPLAFERRYVPSAEEDEEFRLTVGEFGNKKRGFNVFQDGLPEISPGRTETPLEDHRFDLPPPSHALDSYSNNSMISGHSFASPTPTPKPTSYRAQGKENGHPEMTSYNHNRRTLSDSQVYPTHTFYDSTSNPLFNQTHTRSLAFGANYPSYNTYSDNRSPGGFGSNFLSDYNKQYNSMSYTGHPQNHGMENSNSVSDSGGMSFGM